MQGKVKKKKWKNICVFLRAGADKTNPINILLILLLISKKQNHMSPS